jgi:hypothetical protein
MRVFIGVQVLLLVFLVMPASASDTAINHFNGSLHLEVENAELEVVVLRDWEGLADRPELRYDELPPFDFEYFQQGDALIPRQSGPIASDHLQWDYLLAPGRVWQESADGDHSRASLPFSLMERNANCVHNGVLSFLFKSDGSISDVTVSVASETCMYFKLDMQGQIPARYTPGHVAGQQEVANSYDRNLKARLPTLPIEALAEKYPAADLAALANTGKVDPADMTVFGIVVDGVHYLGGCDTRSGKYPFCEQLYLPSYSTAKSLFASLALMRLEKLYPGAAQAQVSDYVPECSGKQWQGVRFIDLLDMTSGNYDSAIRNKDETNPRMDPGFFYPETHAEKIGFSCNAYLRKSPPGALWVYHTTDTYILSAAMSEYLEQRTGEQADIWRDLVLPMWEPLQLSPVTRFSRRTYDERAQPWAGFGLVYQPDDIARLAVALGEGYFDAWVDRTMLDQALQRTNAPNGLPAGDVAHYSHGFYAIDLGGALNCEASYWVPMMSGYGGISVAVLPGGMTYYYFSDGNVHAWARPLQALHRVKPLC